MSQHTVDSFASFVPHFVLRQFAEEVEFLNEPRAEPVDGVLLLADISGFTSLAERLARRGESGTEELTRLLNLYFGQIIDIFTRGGGDVLKFAGDALIALWPCDSTGAADTLLRAGKCALDVQDSLRELRVPGGQRLSLRIGIGVGTVRILQVGGVGGRWEFVAAGSPLTQMSEAKESAGTGQVAVSAEALRILQGRREVRFLEGAGAVLDQVTYPESDNQVRFPALSQKRRNALRGYIPRSILSLVESNRSEWLTELRSLSVLFVNFPGLTYATPLDRAQRVMHSLQTILDRYEGSINKLSVDDKGASMLAAFGLPPLSHEEDPARAVQAAMAIHESMAALDVRTAIGITSGQAFCGIIGSRVRREYTVIGDVVNVAARLMQAAPMDILCDENTHRMARERVRFQVGSPLKLKGKAVPVAVFRPMGKLDSAPSRSSDSKSLLVGRTAEKSILSGHLDRLIQDAKGSTLVIQGEAGIGKSRLLEYLIDEAQSRGIPVLTGRADSIERATPYFAWGKLLGQQLGLDRPGKETARKRIQTILSRLLGETFDPKLLPCLNPVLGTDFPDTALTGELSDQARAERTIELVIDLLSAIPEKDRPKVICLDDAQWLDSPSWAVVLQAGLRVPGLVLVISMRPPVEKQSDDLERLLNDSRTALLKVDPLLPGELTELICGHLGVNELPESLTDLISTKSGCNPLFAEELATNLRESGAVKILNGKCTLSMEPHDLQQSSFPSTIHALLMSRIDGLNVDQQLTAKTASVIGRQFGLKNLSAIHPIDQRPEALLTPVKGLEEREIVQLSADDPQATYAFRQTLLQEVVYSLMAPTQRRQLHQAMGAWLETTFAEELSPHIPLLAHHWSRAVDELNLDPEILGKAVDYLQKAAEQALRSYANHEAVDFLTEALRLLSLTPASHERSSRELVLQSELGPPLIVTRGFAAPEVEHVYRRAWDLCRQLGNTPQSFQVMSGLWNFFIVKTELETARKLSEELYDQAEAQSGPEFLLPARRAMGETLFWLGEPAPARAHLEAVVAHYQADQHELQVLRSGQDPGVVGLGFLAWALWLLGYPDQALSRMAETLALAQRLGHPHSVAMALQNFSMVHQFRGEPALTMERAEALGELSREHGFQLWSAGATIMRGWALCPDGSADTGIELMSGGIEAWRGTGAELPVPYYLSLLAHGHAQKGQIEQGLALVEDAIEASNRSGEAWWRSELFRLRGEWTMALSGDKAPSGEAALLQALELAQRQEAKSLELRAACSLGRLYLRRGRRRDAHRLVGDVFDWFSEGFDTGDLRQARAILKL